MAAADGAPDYARDVAPVLRKYCGGCHNADEANGELRLDTFAELLKGGESGPALVPGSTKVSRIVRVMTGEAEPAMPPEDEKQPTAEEISLIAKWIEAGAIGPQGEAAPPTLVIPAIKPMANVDAPVTAMGLSPDGKQLAVAHFREIEIRSSDDQKVVSRLQGHPGKVNDLTFTPDGKQLLAATGTTGLNGQVLVWDVASAKVVRTLTGHRDTLFAVAISPDGKTIASGSYDRQIKLWDAATGKLRHTLTQHNGAIYDLAFSPDGQLLASASGDETVKIWQVSSGNRLDTLGQPEGEQYAVLFSPDGNRVVAAGADQRIRVWKVVSRERSRINPILLTRYAHEGSITALAWQSSEGRGTLISAADDRTLKTWQANSLQETKLYEQQQDVISAITVDSDREAFSVSRLDGTIAAYNIPTPSDATPSATTGDLAGRDLDLKGEPQKFAEQEPNNQVKNANAIKLPAMATGVIHIHDEGKPDADLFRFTAVAGQRLIVETKGARLKSPVDTKLEILDAQGQQVPRVKLQAVRESYFTFRGKDSSQVGDFRVHNWQDMTLNQYLYAAGEVVKLHTYPRGPDSGFNVYPNRGKRHNYFGTTAVSHALGEPCYVVEPHSPEATLIPNGLPVFKLGYENDDDSERKLGIDSRIDFTAPADGEYYVRVTDTRGFSGESYKYELTLRQPRPSFSIRVEGTDMTVNRESGKRFKLVADRIDGFNGPIQIDIDGVPEGYEVTSPLVIEANHLTADGAIYAFANAEELNADVWKKVKLTATAVIDGNTVTKDAGSLGQVKPGAKPKVLVSLSPAGAEPPPPGEIPEVKIKPGETIQVTLRVQRHGANGVLGFGKEDAGRNLPHGVYVDNIGLNGVLLLPGQNERAVFVTADHWVSPTSRLFFLRTDQENGQCSRPLRITVDPQLP